MTQHRKFREQQEHILHVWQTYRDSQYYPEMQKLIDIFMGLHTYGITAQKEYGSLSVTIENTVNGVHYPILTYAERKYKVILYLHFQKPRISIHMCDRGCVYIDPNKIRNPVVKHGSYNTDDRTIHIYDIAFRYLGINVKITVHTPMNIEDN